MSWNYRVIRSANGAKPPFKEPYIFQIHEVYYNKQSKKIESWIESAETPLGSTARDLSDTIDLMKAAMLKPILEEVDGKLVLIDLSKE